MTAPVALAIGTRPEAIKLAPVADALRARGVLPTLVFTGQHPLEPHDYGLGAYSRLHLGCVGEPDPRSHVRAVAAAIAPHLGQVQLLIVQGDTSSAFGAALGAATAGISVAHVEAGLRSHDRGQPWPEEDFRVAIDQQAALLFAPTEVSAANLRRERVRGAVHVTGNSGIDAIRRLAPGALRLSCERGPKLLVTCHRRENWGTGLAGIAGALRDIVQQEIATVDLLLHPNPATGARMRFLLAGADVHLHTPCPHRQTLAMIAEADLVLSDSGGIQEECAALGVPLLVLRDRTERPEAIAGGAMQLIGTNPQRIVSEVKRLIRRPHRAACADVYGDGLASERIAGVVSNWLEWRSTEPVPKLATAANS